VTRAGFRAYPLLQRALNFGLFDRYLWPLVFAVGVLILRYSPPAPRREWPRLLVGIVAALSALLILTTAALTINVDTYSAARWKAGQIAVSYGVPANTVDAGFEWVGVHATGVFDASLYPKVPPYETWYAAMQPGFRECAVVSGSPLNDPYLHFARTSTYEALGFAGRRTLYIYISHAPSCLSAAKSMGPPVG